MGMTSIEPEPAFRVDWRRDAACRGTATDMFFPIRGANETAKAAKAVCAGCTVRAECLNYALAAGMKIGVWGGLSERERRGVRRDRRRNAGR